jgi:hypothetical protein
VTAKRKLFVAAAIIAAGFGVAKFLGKPLADMRMPQFVGAAIPSQMLNTSAATQSSAAPSATGAMRLVPDNAAVGFDQRGAKPLVEVAPPLMSSSASMAGEMAAAASPYNVQTSAPPTLSPRAKLRNEAPRPLEIDSRAITPLAPPGASPALTTSTTPLFPPSALSSHPNEGTTPPGFAHGQASTPVITASYNDSLASAAITPPTMPPPWPGPDEDEGPRKHVVIDGDSLARLAGRYLDDPRRGTEIYEANRSVLTDPDLLPIGVEILIPDRTSTAATDGSSPQSFMPRAVAIHAPESGRLVPVRPIPVGSSVMPRAQLSRPLPVE